MKVRLAIFLIAALALAAIVLYLSPSAATPSAESATELPATGDEVSKTPAQPSSATPVAAAVAGAAAEASAAVPTPQAPSTAPAATLTGGDSAMLTMYDAIAVAFEEHNNSCDAKGAALEAIVDRSTPDVRQWVDEQNRLTEAERLAAAQRIAQAAGPRMERAQNALRTAMGECSSAEPFQRGLRKLAALNPTQ